MGEVTRDEKLGVGVMCLQWRAGHHRLAVREGKYTVTMIMSENFLGM